MNTNLALAIIADPPASPPGMTGAAERFDDLTHGYVADYELHREPIDHLPETAYRALAQLFWWLCNARDHQRCDPPLSSVSSRPGRIGS